METGFKEGSHGELHGGGEFEQPFKGERSQPQGDLGKGIGQQVQRR